MKWTFKRIMAQIFLTHIGRILLAALFLIIGGIMSPYGTIGEHINYKSDYTIFDTMVWVAVITFVVEFLIMMFWATKNTIGDIKAWWKRRQNK
jgi:hypothetical protein